MQTLVRQVYGPMIAIWRKNLLADRSLGSHPFLKPKLPKRKAIEYRRDDKFAPILKTALPDELALILFLSFAGGPRASEVCRVMDSDVDWQARTVLLPQTKGEPRLLVWRRPSMRRCCRSRVATPSSGAGTASISTE